MEKNTVEFWKILKSFDSKKFDQNNELKELFNDTEKTVKHVQDQGRCKIIMVFRPH
jgi:hemoglobin-like flavoprotein